MRSWRGASTMGAMTRARTAAILVIVLLAASALFLAGRGDTVGVALSAMRRTILAASPTDYWSLEDANNATSAGSALPGGAPLTSGGRPGFGLEDGPAGSGSLPDFTSGSLTGLLTGTSTDSWTIEFVLKADSPTGLGTKTLVQWTTGGNPGYWAFQAEDNPLNTALLYYQYNDGTSGTIDFDTLSSAIPDVYDGQWHHYQVTRWTVSSISANPLVTLFVDGVYAGNWTIAGSGGTIGAANGPITFGPEDDSSLTSFSIGHAALWSPALTYSGTYNVSSSTTAAAVLGHAGETATTRFARLCTEAGVAYNVAT